MIANGTVVTMDNSKHIFKKGTIAIDDGKIVGVGNSDDMRAYKADNYIDAKGNLVLPGFVNCHTHTQSFTTNCRGLGVEGWGGLYTKSMPNKELTPEEDRHYLSLACILGDIRGGITTEADQDFGEPAVAKAIEKVKMRGHLSQYFYSLDLQATKIKGYTFSKEQEEKTFKSALSFIDDWDGKAEGRITCDLAPHATDSCTPELLKNVREEANKRGKRITIHVSQMLEEVKEIKKRYNKTPVEYLRDNDILGSDCYAAHCIHLTDEDIRLLAKTDTKICHCPLWFARRGLSAQLANWVKSGIAVGLGLDSDEDMIRYMQVAHIAAAFRDPTVGFGGGFKAYDMLKFATINSAIVIGKEKEIGSLEVGKKADVIVINFNKPHLTPSIDPIADLVYYGKGSDVDTTIIDGKIVYAEGEIKTINEKEVLLKAQVAGERAFSRSQEN
ncbi:MAG: amidohydrolase [Candidatus Bathyarchaeota archaeon]